MSNSLRGGVPGSEICILVIEDEVEMRDLIAETVTTFEKARAITAANAHEALEILKSETPDIVLLDIMMPGDQNGLDVVRYLRELQHGCYVPVIVITALDSFDTREQALSVGADDYLVKPFQLRELKARLKTWTRIRSLSVALEDELSKLKYANRELVHAGIDFPDSDAAMEMLHSFGQPLAAISVCSHILARETSRDDVRFKLIQSISDSAERLTTLLDLMKKAKESS